MIRHRVYLAKWLLTVLSTATVVAAQPAETPQRVRTKSTAIRTAIGLGLERSLTFATLYQALQVTDGLVYVSEGECRSAQRGCLHLSITGAPAFRILRVVVNVRRASGCVLSAVIGHELQHALEALSNPRVRKTPDLYFFFKSIGSNGSRPFETAAAVSAGAAVQRETCEVPGARDSRTTG